MFCSHCMCIIIISIILCRKMLVKMRFGDCKNEYMHIKCIIIYYILYMYILYIHYSMRMVEHCVQRKESADKITVILTLSNKLYDK